MSEHKRSRRSARYQTEDQTHGRQPPAPRQDREGAQQGYVPSPDASRTQRPSSDTGRQPAPRRSAYERPMPQGQPNARQASAPRRAGLPLYRSPLLMLILLILLPPVGIFLLWKFGRQMRTVKLVLTVISLLILALFVFLLTKNLRTAPQTPEPPSGDPGVEMTVSGPQQQTANANDSIVQTVDIYAGSDIVGKRAFLTISTENTQTFTGKDLAAIADAYVQGRGYSWFTVVMDDGSGEGYVFNGDSTDTAIYGVLSDEGAITEPIATLFREGNDYVAD